MSRVGVPCDKHDVVAMACVASNLDDSSTLRGGRGCSGCACLCLLPGPCSSSREADRTEWRRVRDRIPSGAVL